MKDYRTYRYKITQKMVDDCKSSIAKNGYEKSAADLTLIED